MTRQGPNEGTYDIWRKDPTADGPTPGSSAYTMASVGWKKAWDFSCIWWCFIPVLQIQPWGQSEMEWWSMLRKRGKLLARKCKRRSTVDSEGPSKGGPAAVPSYIQNDPRSPIPPDCVMWNLLPAMIMAATSADQFCTQLWGTSLQDTSSSCRLGIPYQFGGMQGFCIGYCSHFSSTLLDLHIRYVGLELRFLLVCLCSTRVFDCIVHHHIGPSQAVPRPSELPVS